jgi:hypothetical protein
MELYKIFYGCKQNSTELTINLRLKTVASSQSYKNFTSEIYENSAVFLQVFKIQSYKAFFTSEFFWWILQVNFSLKNSLE